MQYRELGRIGWKVSTISFGAWAIGGTWGDVKDEESLMAQMALRWILMSPAVTCAIPGAKRPSQVEENVKAADLPALSDQTMNQVRAIYDRLVRRQVHYYW